MLRDGKLFWWIASWPILKLVVETLLVRTCVMQKNKIFLLYCKHKLHTWTFYTYSRCKVTWIQGTLFNQSLLFLGIKLMVMVAPCCTFWTVTCDIDLIILIFSRHFVNAVTVLVINIPFSCALVRSMGRTSTSKFHDHSNACPSTCTPRACSK